MCPRGNGAKEKMVPWEKVGLRRGWGRGEDVGRGESIPQGKNVSSGMEKEMGLVRIIP
jgi:hypothetical protein